MTNPLRGIAPTELRPGEDPVARFVAEVEAVQGTLAHSDAAGLAHAVTTAVVDASARRVALTADLGAAREGLLTALRAAGVDAAPYEDLVPHRDRIAALEATVTGCQAAVAATGSILTGGASGRAGALVAPTHICVVERGRLVDGLLDLMRRAPAVGASALALQSGPSRTADIEKTLVLGMHGPKRVHVVLLDGALG
ncbi:MAG: LUD domain-containing protein [Thermoleophilia bacterium]